MRIAFTGLAGCGKSLAAAYLVGNYGFTRLSFAAKLKANLVALHERPLDKRKDRALMQKYGIMNRKINPKYWIIELDKQLCLLPSCTDVVIDDLRFMNEAEFLRDRGFYIVKITGRERNMSQKEKEHASEQDIKLIQPDFTITNDGSFLHLFMSIEDVIGANINSKGDILFEVLHQRRKFF